MSELVTVESMRTRTEAFKRHQALHRIQAMEEDGWAVRTVVALTETLVLVVFETER